MVRLGQKDIEEVVTIQCARVENRPWLNSDRDKVCDIRRVDPDKNLMIEYMDEKIEIDTIRVDSDHETFHSPKSDNDFSITFAGKTGDDCEVFTKAGERKLYCGVDW